MRHRAPWAVMTAFVFVLSATPGCGPGVDLEQVAESGRVTLLDGEQQVLLDVETLDIYLVDPDYDDAYPETFQLLGDELELVGSFPRDLRVGYEADFSRLVDRPVSVTESLVNGYDKRRSRLRAPEFASGVRGGTLTVTRVLGHNPNGAGQVLEGTLRLDLDNGRSTEGTFTVLAKTWG